MVDQFGAKADGASLAERGGIVSNSKRTYSLISSEGSLYIYSDKKHTKA